MGLHFVSYSRRDGQDFADWLYDCLWETAPDTQPWMDRRDLIDGFSHDTQLQEAISKSDSLLLVLTKDASNSYACRNELKWAGPPFAAVSTLVRDAVHFAGAVTVDHCDQAARLVDDPFARLHPARILRLGPGLLGHVPPPPGPAIQRYAGKPWPAPGFDTG